MCVFFLFSFQEKRGKSRAASDKRKWGSEIKTLRKELKSREEVMKVIADNPLLVVSHFWITHFLFFNVLLMKAVLQKHKYHYNSLPSTFLIIWLISQSSPHPPPPPPPSLPLFCRAQKAVVQLLGGADVVLATTTGASLDGPLRYVSLLA